MIINPIVGDGYTMATLTAAMEKLPFVPGRIGQMGLFSNEGIPSTSVLIEERDRVLTLVANTRRGAPATGLPREPRKVRSLACTHLPLEEFVSADDVLNLREFGTENAQATVDSRINGKLTAMKQSLAATLEWMRLGALKGTITDGAGTTVYNLRSEFKLPTPASVDFLLGTTTTDIRGLCMDVANAIIDALGGRPMDHIHAFCGATFFKRLVGHADVKEQMRYVRPEENTNNPAIRGSYEYGGVYWEPYRGVISGKPCVDAGGCIFFPVGVPDIYKTWYAPSTWLESVGQLGQPFYAKQIPADDNSGVRILAQSNPLPVCLVPQVLRTGTSSN